MIRGRIIGEVWATKKTPGIAGRKLVLVSQLAVYSDGSRVPTGRVVVATDNLDASVGEEVVVAFGSGARNSIVPGSRTVLTDAAVVQVIDGSSS